MAIIKKDRYGLYVKEAGFLFRPIPTTRDEIHSITEESELSHGDNVPVHYNSAEGTATVDQDEVWAVHGVAFGRESADCFPGVDRH